MTYSYKKTAVAIIVFTLLLSVILILIAYRNKEPVNNEFMLKSYDGSVALYQGEKIITVYDGVVLATLPRADRQRLIEGITVKDPEDAEIIIEDYDG